MSASRIPLRFSIKTLLETPFRKVVDDIANRATVQHANISKYPHLRPVTILKSLYRDTYESLTVSPVGDSSSNVSEDMQARILEKKLRALETRHSMVDTLADVYTALDSAQATGCSLCLKAPIRDNINDILRRQTGISILLQHTVALSSKTFPRPTGCIENHDIKKLCEDVRLEAVTLAEHHFNWSPEILINHTNSDGPGSSSLAPVWMIPSLGRFVLMEVFKNALYATAKKFHTERGLEMGPMIDPDITAESPPVVVDIISSDAEVLVRITDRGVGMSEDQVKNATKFLWSSTIKSMDLVNAQTSYQPAPAPLRGLGVGLSLSYIYATHFGGDLIIQSDGLGAGTTVTLKIPRDVEILEALL